MMVPSATRNDGLNLAKRRRASWSPGSAAWFLVDLILAYVGMRTAFLLSPSFNPVLETSVTSHVSSTTAAMIYSTLVAVIAHTFRLHDPLLPRHSVPMLIRSLGAVSVALAAFAAIVFAVIYERVGRYILVQAFLYTWIGMGLVRALIWQRLAQRRRRLVLLGGGPIANLIGNLIREYSLPADVVGVIEYEGGGSGSQLSSHSAAIKPSKLNHYCLELEIDEVVTCIGTRFSDKAVNEFMECLNTGIRVTDFTGFVERSFFQVPVAYIVGEWFLDADLEVLHPVHSSIKRGLDIAAALAGLVLTAPLLLLAILAIRLESGGAVFYSQIRTGRFNNPFRIWKLRSMRLDAEKEGPRWAAQADDRTTFVGRFLRKTRLDEIPQFWNILRGEMSLVGPRPERPEFVEKLAAEIPFYRQRHLVKPGLTGWAQINYPYGSSVEDSLHKLEYDLYYVKHASLALDLQIMLRTLGALMKGAR